MSNVLGFVIRKQTPEKDTFMDDLGIAVIHVCPFICDKEICHILYYIFSMKFRNNVEPNNVSYFNYYTHKTYKFNFHMNKCSITFIVWAFLLNFCHISLPSWHQYLEDISIITRSKPNFSSSPPKPALSAAFLFCLRLKLFRSLLTLLFISYIISNLSANLSTKYLSRMYRTDFWTLWERRGWDVLREQHRNMYII